MLHKSIAEDETGVSREKPMTEPGGGLSKARLRRLHDVMAGHVEHGGIPGLVALVCRRGEVHVDALGVQALGGGAPMRPDTIFRIASMTKPITAVAAMILVEECKLRLDDAVDRLLPELANRRVLKRIDGPLDDTVPANRPITLRDLLTMRFGLGAIMVFPSRYPIQKAMEAAEVAPGPDFFRHSPDEFMKRLGALPLACQPGEKWLYHTGLDVLGVLVARACGQSLESFLGERIFGPLGMKDTGFYAPADKVDRLATCYRLDHASGRLAVFDEARGGRFDSPPRFEAGGAGLVSTADDYLAFCQMMLGNGSYRGARILSRASVELMTTDQLTAEQKADNDVFFCGSSGWGFGMAVTTRRDNLWTTPGGFGWAGGYGTSAYTDPKEALIGVLMTQRLMDSPEPPPVHRDFWTLAYGAIDD